MLNIKWFGHSMWKFYTADVSVVVDPFTDIGYPLPTNETADIVVSTHDHFDHNNFSLIRGNFKKITKKGEYSFKGVDIKTIQVWHDKSHGLKRGKNLLAKIDIAGFSLLHCGDLGHILDNYTVSQLGQIDIIFIPVGGTYTIDAKEAKEVIDLINPKIIFPMHYKTPAIAFDIAKLDDFTRLYDKNDIYFHDSNEIKITKDDLAKYKIVVCIKKE